MILARFRDLEALKRAERRLREAGREHLEMYAPFEFESERRGSLVPLFVLIAGLGGALGFFLLETYSNTVAWRMNIGGRPDYSWPVYIGNAFEVGILCAMATGALALFIASGLPRLFAPVDRFTMFPEASRTGFFLLLDTPDPASDRVLLDELQPLRVEEMA